MQILKNNQKYVFNNSVRSFVVFLKIYRIGFCGISRSTQVRPKVNFSISGIDKELTYTLWKVSFWFLSKKKITI